MTLLQATARNSANSPIARVLTPKPHGRSANDNNANAPASQLVFEDALHHFAKHGLGAAKDARDRAEAAFYAGDKAQYNYWLAICRTLDRRMARQAVQTLEI
ncbi:MAG: hypothetical protein ABJ242_08220 [Marinomonas sp.]